MDIANNFKFRLIGSAIIFGLLALYLLNSPNILFDYENATNDERTAHLTEMGNLFLDGGKSLPGSEYFSLTGVDPEEWTIHIDANFDRFNDREEIFSPKTKALIKKNHRSLCNGRSRLSLFYIQNIRVVITYTWRGEVMGTNPVSKEDCAQF